MALTTAQVQTAYLAYFARPADPTGLQFWTTIYTGTDIQALLAQVSTAPEFTSTVAGKSNFDIVSSLYINMLGRTAANIDVAGALFWTGLLDAGTIKVADVAYQIYLSAQTTSDKAVIDAKVAASTAFTAALDTAAEISAYQGANALTIANAYLLGITDTATSTAKIATLPTVTANLVSGSAGGAGQTFTLTTALDTVNGTSGNDTIKGDFTATATLNASDSINGSSGEDTLQMYGVYAAANVPITLSGVETIQLMNSAADTIISTAAISGVTKLQIDDAQSTGTAAYTTGAGTKLQLSTSAGAVSTGLTTWTASATDTSQNLVLNGYQGVAGGAEGALTITGAATTTLNITSQGTTPAASTAANQISTLTAAATTTKVVVSGASGLEINTSLTGAAIAEVDASASTGGVAIAVNGTAAILKFTGGSGNDTVTFGATNTFTTADTVVGGSGNDTLAMRNDEAANTSAAFTNITGIETLRITEATTAADTYNLDHFGVQNIRFDAVATATTNVSNIASGATLTLGTVGGGVALAIKNNGTADALTIAARGAAGTYTIDASQFENLTINTSAVTGNTVFALTDAQMKEVTLVNTTAAGTNPDFSVNLGTLGVVTNKVDVSAFKAATATNGVTLALSGSAVNGAIVTGSANNDVIGGSSQADTITSGNGADSITAGAGADTIDLTETAAAIDNVIFSAAATNGADIIKAFAVGTGVDTLTLVNADTTVATSGAAAVLGASAVALVVGGGAYTTTSSTTTSDVIEITTVLDTAVTLSASSTGADLLQALSSDTTVSSGITATTASDAAFFLVYQNNNAYLFHGNANGGGVGGTSLIEAAEITLVGVVEGIAAGAFVSGDILMAV